MFSNGPLDFSYAAHNQMASTVMNMTLSLTYQCDVKRVMVDGAVRRLVSDQPQSALLIHQHQARLCYTATNPFSGFGVALG